MHRQSITPATLRTLIRRSDFKGVPSASRPAFSDQLVSHAFDICQSLFATYPLKKWILREKPHFAPSSKPAELLLRKVAKNLLYAVPKDRAGRQDIVENLKHLLAEGVPYRLYRLDISSFYESLDLNEVRQIIRNCEAYAPCTKNLSDAILSHQLLMGDSGVPRGLAASAILSELMMKKFDSAVMQNKNTFFYARYVDDIVIITGAKEDPENFKNFLSNGLPAGLAFNEKKTAIKSLPKSLKDTSGNPKLIVEYLGYEFSVFDSVLSNGSERTVKCTISEKKIKKIKTRIVRALLDYERTADDGLLVDRIKFLTTNFKVFNNNSGSTNMAGIYFNYPLIDQNDKKLKALDSFLIGSILGVCRRGGRSARFVLGNALRKRLLTFSFERGHREQIFTHFSGNRLDLIGKCWKF